MRKDYMKFAIPLAGIASVACVNQAKAKGMKGKKNEVTTFIMAE